MKTCTICHEEKTLEEFTKSKKSPDGRGSYCKPCHRQYTKDWTTNNIDRVRQNRHEYNVANAPKISAQNKARKAKNPSYYLEYGRRYAVEKPHKAMLYEARQRAKDFDVPFQLVDEDIVIPEFCPILGIKLERGKTDSNRDCCPSLDRVFPELGYIPSNIAVVSYRANRIKNNGTSAEHRKIADWMDGFAPPN